MLCIKVTDISVVHCTFLFPSTGVRQHSQSTLGAALSVQQPQLQRTISFGTTQHDETRAKIELSLAWQKNSKQLMRSTLSLEDEAFPSTVSEMFRQNRNVFGNFLLFLERPQQPFLVDSFRTNIESFLRCVDVITSGVRYCCHTLNFLELPGTTSRESIFRSYFLKKDWVLLTIYRLYALQNYIFRVLTGGLDLSLDCPRAEDNTHKWLKTHQNFCQSDEHISSAY